MRNKKYKFKYKSTKDDKKTKEISFLEKHNAYSYLEDLNIMGKLFNISKSKRDWIETTRYQLQNSANIYEKTFAEYLHNKKIQFIHQAPYVIDNKIYFLDFYLKDYKSKAGMPIPYRGGMKALFVLLVCNVSFYCFFRDMSDALAIIRTRPQCREAAP